MMNWAENVLSGLDRARSEDDVFAKVEVAAADLDFKYCAYGLRVP